MKPTVVTEDLWKELHDGLFSFVRRRVDSDPDAEDILQEIFVRIHTNLQGVKDSESIHAWVYQIARNAIADHYRARKQVAHAARAAAAVTRDEPPFETDDLEPQAPAELAGCMRPLLDGLPDAYAEAIELTELGDLTQKAAAQRLGLSVSGMKSRVQRGRSQLRELLLDCCDVELDRRKRVVGYEVNEEADVSCGDCGCQPGDR
jgi:RNA polymerase sigma-70 factor (ECF subfamily)